MACPAQGTGVGWGGAEGCATAGHVQTLAASRVMALQGPGCGLPPASCLSHAEVKTRAAAVHGQRSFQQRGESALGAWAERAGGGAA